MSQEKLQDLLQLLEVEGVEPSSPQFHFKIMEMKVTTCQENQFLSSCDDCAQQEVCELSREYRIAVKYGTAPQESS